MSITSFLWTPYLKSAHSSIALDPNLPGLLQLDSSQFAAHHYCCTNIVHSFSLEYKSIPLQLQSHGHVIMDIKLKTHTHSIFPIP